MINEWSYTPLSNVKVVPKKDRQGRSENPH